MDSSKETRSSSYGATSNRNEDVPITPSRLNTYRSPRLTKLPRNALTKLEYNKTDEDSSDDEDYLLHSQERLLERASRLITLPHDVDRAYRGKELRLLSFARPHMRAFHGSWICFFLSFFVQFALAPLLPEIQTSLSLTKADIWLTNIWSMVGGVFLRFMLGPLCDKYGARIIMTSLLAGCAIPCMLTGLVETLRGLILVRLIMGAMDTFVPGQYWITCMFVREVGGTAMAISGGWGAAGSGVVQLMVGTLIFPLCAYLAGGDTDLAWRLSLVFPALLALLAAWFFFFFSDDCPLGNYAEVKKAGLMMERSAVDSFRSGVLNLNSWILFLQFAGSCGVDFTMCNGTAIYFHDRFQQPIASAGAIAFLYGIGSVYARGLGGYLSDVMGAYWSLRGRLYAQMISMIAQGLLTVWFSRVSSLYPSLAVMVVFSILVQMSMGTCYAIVPFVDGHNTGSVAGIVGAGGNVGAIILGNIFRSHSYEYAVEYMGWFAVVLAFLTPLIVIKGYRGILFGKDDDRAQRLTLMVPS